MFDGRGYKGEAVKKPKDWTDLPLLPPRKRNWKKGTAQIGLFIRLEDGSTVQSCRDRAAAPELALAMALFVGSMKLPSALIHELRAWDDERRAAFEASLMKAAADRIESLQRTIRRAKRKP